MEVWIGIWKKILVWNGIWNGIFLVWNGNEMEENWQYGKIVFHSISYHALAVTWDNMSKREGSLTFNSSFNFWSSPNYIMYELSYS